MYICNRIWHLAVPVKSHDVQLEAMHSSKQSDFERESKGKTKVLTSRRKQRFRALSGLESRSNNDSERQVANY